MGLSYCANVSEGKKIYIIIIHITSYPYIGGVIKECIGESHK